MTEPNLKLHGFLRRAVMDRSLPRINKHLDAGAPINLYQQGRKVLPPLHEAARNGFIDVLELLCSRGANIDFRGPELCTAFTISADHNQVDAGRWLLQHGANHSLEKCPGESALRLALTHGYFDFASMILEERPAIVANELIPLSKWFIAHSESIDVAEWMLKSGISPNACDCTGKSWLRISQSRQENIAEAFTDLLLSFGADVNNSGNSPNSALAAASEWCRVRLSLKLLAAGANPDHKDWRGIAPREFIMKKWNEQDISDFLAICDSINARKSIDKAAAPLNLKPL